MAVSFLSRLMAKSTCAWSEAETGVEAAAENAFGIRGCSFVHRKVYDTRMWTFCVVTALN